MGLILIIVLGLVFLLFPGDLFAWGPATHLRLGLSILDNLKILSGSASSLISNNAVQFLYGCVSADIIQAKRMLKYVENCHNWENGFKLLRSAKSPSLKSFAMGYLSHLAADIIAHNCFIPSKMIETYSSRGLKHFLWEMRFDMAMINRDVRKVLKDLIKQKHEEEDELMNGLLKTAFFSFKTNKRIFSSLLLVERVKKWEKLMKEPYIRNNYYLDSSEIDYYFKLSMDAILSFLIDTRRSKYLNYDPTGKKSLGKALAVMRDLKNKEKQGTLSDEHAHNQIAQSVSYFRSGFLK